MLHSDTSGANSERKSGAVGPVVVDRGVVDIELGIKRPVSREQTPLDTVQSNPILNPKRKLVNTEVAVDCAAILAGTGLGMLMGLPLLMAICTAMIANALAGIITQKIFGE